MFTGKHAAGTPKAGGYFVKNQKRIILFCERAGTGNIALRLVDHPCGALHQGLHNEAANLVLMPF